MPKSGEHKVGNIDSFFRQRPSINNVREGELITFLEDGKLIKQEKRNGVVYQSEFSEAIPKLSTEEVEAGVIREIIAGDGLTGGGIGGEITLNVGAGTHITVNSNDIAVNTSTLFASPTFTGTAQGANLTLTGDLTVQGDTTTLNTATLQVEDNNIVLNYLDGDSSSTADGAGITIQDAVNSTTDATILWSADFDRFNFSHAINVTGNISVSGTVDGRDLATDGSKLDGIESNATADQTASEILTAIKTVDGATSGLDSDLLDGQHGSYYLDFGNFVIDDDEIPIAKLASDSVSYGGVSVTLGSSDATPAFDLSDATSLPIVAGTSGTLSVARGGTGATTLTNNSVLTGTGTSAITAESNLTFDGSSLLLQTTTGSRNIEVGYGATGDVTSFVDLIGDTTYSDYGARFIRFGGANATTDFRHRGTGDFRFIAQDSAAISLHTGSTERLRISSAGDLTISGGSLTLPATEKLFFDGGNGTYVHELSDNVIEFRTDNNPQLKIDNSAGVIVNDGSYSSFDFRVESNNNTHMLFVDSGNDRVGIGTNSPAFKTTIYSDSTTDSFPLVVGQPNSANEFVGIGLSGFVASNGAVKAGLVLDRKAIYGVGDIHILNNTTTDNSNATLSDSKLTILQNGNVGIGTTSPSEKLHIYGSVDNDDVAVHIQNAFDDDSSATPPSAALTFTTASNNAYLRVFGAPANTADNHKIELGSTAASSYITFKPSNSEAMRIGSSGNVGINQGNKLYFDGTNVDDLGQDTYIQSDTADNLRFVVGNRNMIEMIEDDSQDMVVIGNGMTDVDFVVEDDAGVAVLTVDSSTSKTTLHSLAVTNDVELGDVTADNVASNSFHYNNGGSLGAEAFTIGASGGVNFTSAISLANAEFSANSSDGAVLSLKTTLTDADFVDILGRINFSAPVSGNPGDDSRLLAASIVAQKSATFSSTSNQTDMIFQLGVSETASEKFRILSDGKIKIGNSYTLPSSDGSANQILKTNGSGTLSFADGGISFSGSTANGLLTYGNSTTADVESNLTFDGSTNVLTITGETKSTKGFTSDGNAKAYTWRAVNNTSSTTPNYIKIARITGTQSSRFVIELAGRAQSYSDNQLPAMGYIVGQLNNDNNFDIVYYNHKHGGTNGEVVDEVGQVDVDSTTTDIYLKVLSFAEVTASGHISDGSFTIDSTNAGTSEPASYSVATEYIVWNSANDGPGSGLNADLLDNLGGGSYLRSDADDSFTGSNLNLEGNLKLTTNATYLYFKDASGTSFRGMGINSINNFYLGPIDPFAGGFMLYGASANTSGHVWYSGNAEAMRITSGRNVGIGVADPSTKLEVAGPTRISGVGNALIFDTTGAEGSNFISTINDYETVISNTRGGAGFGVFGNNNIRLGFGTNYTTAETDLFINYTGDVGIGVTSPAHKLDVNGGIRNYANGSAVLRTESTAAGYGAYNKLITTTNTYDLYALNGDFIIDESGVATRLIIKDTTGNVGIGVSPSQKLHVAGSVRADTAYYVDGNIVINTDGNFEVHDTRAVTPSTDIGLKGVRFDFKNNSADGLSDGGSYHGVMTFQQWNDTSGGHIHALGFTDNGYVHHRNASIGGTFGNWKKLIQEDNSGNVGIGVVSPNMKLNISHGDQDGLRFNCTSTTGEAFIDFGDSGDNDAGSIRYDHNDDSMKFRVNASERARIVNTGAFHVTNDVVAFSSTPSDKKLKTNVKDIEYGLDTIMKLKPKQYDWKKDNRHDIGFIAQEVEEVIPEIVKDNEWFDDKIKTMDYEKLTAVLIKAVQEQQQQINELKEKLNG